MEFTRAKKVTKRSSDEEIRRRLLNWPDAYYREREPEIRLRMLEEAENQGLTPEDNADNDRPSRPRRPRNNDRRNRRG